MDQPHAPELARPVTSVDSPLTRAEGRRVVVSRSLLAGGLVFAAMSLYFTLVSAWDPLFQSPNLPDGPTHPNYHAFRLFTVAAGASLIMLYCMFLPRAKRSPELWNVMLVAALSYIAGWWLAWPLFVNRRLVLVVRDVGVVDLASRGGVGWSDS